ncbi:hypothetical protein GpartN1_g7437.t1 [Galdieria partita]|uniref:Uncharacterized protein n=1 Tax=Galdieria partita TaxID=83374 RepID=A0A9C7Q5X6_9RHOD|nr:hypothetical protein GpartN1_g7437.t1 [Galdieria partita]
MENSLSSGIMDCSDIYLSTVLSPTPFSLSLKGNLVDLEKSSSLNNLSDTTGSQHSVTGYSFLAFAEKYLDVPSRRMDCYDGLPCSLSSSSCSPTTMTKNSTKTTDLGVSYVSSLFGSSVTSCDSEENSAELLLHQEDTLAIEMNGWNEEELSSSIHYSRISVDSEHDG